MVNLWAVKTTCDEVNRNLTLGGTNVQWRKVEIQVLEILKMSNVTADLNNIMCGESSQWQLNISIMHSMHDGKWEKKLFY